MNTALEKLCKIKEELKKIELNLENEINIEKYEKDYNERINKKLPLIARMKDNKIKINAGNNYFFYTTKDTINNFPYKLSLKEDLKDNYNENEEIFVDSSYNMFSAILKIIRHFNNNNYKDKVNTVISTYCINERLKTHAKEFFMEDTDEVFNHFMFKYINPNNKNIIKDRAYKDDNINKWSNQAKIKCFKCGKDNDGNFWKKKLSTDRKNDEFVIQNYYATCSKCDLNNTLNY